MEFKIVLTENETIALCNATISTMTEERRASHQFEVNLVNEVEAFCNRHSDKVFCFLDVLTAMRAAAGEAAAEAASEAEASKGEESANKEAKTVKLDKPDGK